MDLGRRLPSAVCWREADEFGRDQQVAPALPAARSPLLVLADTQAQLRKTVRVRRTEPQNSGQTATTLPSGAGSDAERKASVWLLSKRNHRHCQASARSRRICLPLNQQAVDLPSCLQAARKGLGFSRGSCMLPARQAHSLCLRVAAQQRSGNCQSGACMLGHGDILVRNLFLLIAPIACVYRRC